MNFLSPLLDLVYPRACALCSGAAKDASHICWDCFSKFTVITEPYCSKCGDPVESMVEHKFWCSVCQKSEPHFEMARSAVRYRGVGKNLVHALKYNTMTCVVDDMVQLLHACVEACYSERTFDVVTYVPLHPSRERQRTYNQSRLLAKGLARKLGVPMLAEAIKKHKMTSSQTGLKAAGRKKNVAGVFDVAKKDWVKGRRFLLVDDVMTTGATVGECSRVLKETGAAAVYIVTVARG